MSDASWKLEQGDEIAPGRIALKRLGGGPQYEAYLAWDDRLFSIVVAKLVRPDQVETERVRRALRREAELLARLAHPVIVRQFGAELDGPRPHLVLEHLEGPTLRSLIRRFGPLALEQVLPLALHVCAALHYLVTSDVVHLDVKPGNIVMGAPPRLIDFSVARSRERARRITEEIGTHEFMAPEQCVPGRLGEIGPPADVWGLGTALYEAVGGVRAFPRGEGEEDGIPEGGYTQLTREPPPLPKELPAPVTDLVARCLRKDPSERPAAHEVAVALEPLVASLPRAPRLGRRRPRLG